MPIKCMETPSEQQKAFFRASTRFVAYGGARGGGKSWAVRKKAVLLAVHYAGIRILLLRRTYPELRENHILPLLKDLKEAAVFKETEKAFLFPNGSRLKFGYCAAERDVLQYQGQEFDVIFLDEATQFTEFQFSTLTACLRGANRFPKRFYLTCNPGGIGHAWVKRLFIQRDYRPTECPDEYTFIPARVYDNHALLSQDSGYVRMLENLSAPLRRAWLDGDWNVFAGQFFPEFSEAVHVCTPFEIPAGWRRYFTMDYGLDMLAGYWVAMDGGGRAWVYRELYQSNLVVSDAAQEILTRSKEHMFCYLAPPDLWNRRQDTGRSAADIFAAHGISLVKVQNSRAQGWLDLREWLKPRPEGARLQIFSTCVHLIRSLPALQFDRKDPNDCATEPHEYTHAPDALRYFAAGRPAAANFEAPAAHSAGEYDRQVESLLDYR